MTAKILKEISEIPTPGLFITAEFSQIGERMPVGIDSFIKSKLSIIAEGVHARKFVFQEETWRIILTFFPTNSVVDERYALKNKIMKNMI